MFEIYDFEDFVDFFRMTLLPLILILGVLIGCIFLLFKICYSVTYREFVRVDMNGKIYYSSDLVESDGDYYYKNADGQLVKIEFYEGDSNASRS